MKRGPGSNGRVPAGGAIGSAAARLVERHGDALLATARRYATTTEDAEDAYQRALEILLVKAPQVPEDELLPWMRTVVKHEAFAIWRSRERAVPASDDLVTADAGTAAAPEDQVHHYERLSVGAEALSRLKPQEVRCLLLRAEGYSYRQICEETGWTYTKVNRCITEGRRSFADRVSGIESGAECDRLAPLLSALADGEATAEELTTLRPHLRSCHSCRARLREYREVPRTLLALLPVAGMAGPQEGPLAGAWRWAEPAVAWVQDRAALLAVKAQAAAEGVSAGKVAAVAASAAAIAGGTVAVSSLEDPVAAKPPIAEEPVSDTPAGIGDVVPATATAPRRGRPRAEPASAPALEPAGHRGESDDGAGAAPHSSTRDVPAGERGASAPESRPVPKRLTTPARDIPRDDPRAQERDFDPVVRRPVRRGDEQPADSEGETSGEAQEVEPVDQALPPAPEDGGAATPPL